MGARKGPLDSETARTNSPKLCERMELMAKDYTSLARDIVENVGGKENIATLTHCVTRLRFTLKDPAKLNKSVLEQLKGVIQVLDVGGQIQVVIGTKVVQVYDAVLEVTGLVGGGEVAAQETGKSNFVGKFISLISGLFTPLMAGFTGAGMLKVVLILLTNFNLMDTASGTYQILYAGADAIFYFLPLALGFSAAKKFGCNPYVALAVTGALIYPDMVAVYNAGTELKFLGIPVVLMSYASSVIPAIAAIWFTSLVEKGLRKVIPDVVQNIFLGMLEIMICVPAAYLVIGPITSYAGTLMASGYTFIMNINPVIAGALVAFFWPCFVIFGLHWGFIPIVLNNIATTGFDTLFVITGPNNMAQAGAALGVFLKTKDSELKGEAGSCALTAILAGVTEPAIYGINLKYKKPFYIAMVFTGIAGGIVAAAGTRVPALVGTSLLTLPAYAGVGFVGFLIACAIAYFGTAICTYLFGFNDSMIIRK